MGHILPRPGQILPAPRPSNEHGVEGPEPKPNHGLHVSGWQRASQSSLWKPRAHSNTGSSQHFGGRHCSKRLTWLPHKTLTITLGGEEKCQYPHPVDEETWATGMK